MPQIISCPQCQKQLQVPESLFGKQIKCSTCGAVFVVPGGEEAAIAPAPPASESRTLQCVQCGTQLMVPTSMLGQAVRCPKCGTAFTASAGTAPSLLPQPIPQASIQPAFDPPPRRPEPSSSDVGDAPRPRSSRWDDDEDEFAVARGLRRDSLRKPVTGFVLPPAICLLITGILGVIINLFQAVVAVADPQMLLQNNPFAQNTPPVVAAISGGLFALVSLGTIAGAISMMRQQWYGLAMAGTILAMINVGNCCCIMGLPFGIWGLVMLCRPDVKESF